MKASTSIFSFTFKTPYLDGFSTSNEPINELVQLRAESMKFSKSTSNKRSPFMHRNLLGIV